MPPDTVGRSWPTLSGMKALRHSFRESFRPRREVQGTNSDMRWYKLGQVVQMGTLMICYYACRDLFTLLFSRSSGVPRVCVLVEWVVLSTFKAGLNMNLTTSLSHVSCQMAVQRVRQVCSPLSTGRFLSRLKREPNGLRSVWSTQRRSAATAAGKKLFTPFVDHIVGSCPLILNSSLAHSSF